MIGVNYLKPVQKYCKNSVVKNLLIGYLNKYSKKKIKQLNITLDFILQQKNCQIYGFSQEKNYELP